MENPFSKYRKVESAKSAETLFRVMADGTMKVVGIDEIKGEKGDKGESIKGDKGDSIKGDDGVGIESTKVSENGYLYVTYTDGRKEKAGYVKGEKGEKGDTTIVEKTIIRETGVAGKDGRGIKNVAISDAGELVISFTDETEKNYGRIVGKDGEYTVVNNTGGGVLGISIKDDGESVGNNISSLNFTGSGINSITKDARGQITVDITGGGSGSGAYLESSFTSQTSVTVAHNFGAYPIVYVMDSGNAQIIPLTVVQNTINDFTVTFSALTTGKIISIASSGIPSGTTVHNGLSGLSADDHTQYHNDTRGDIRYYTKSQIDTSLSGKETANANIVKTNVSSTFTKAQYQTMVTLTDAATVAWNLQDGNIATVTLGGNRTLGLPTNMGVGAWVLIVKQDGTGSRTLAYNAIFKFAASTPPTLSTAANAVDFLSFINDGTNMFCVPNLNFG